MEIAEYRRLDAVALAGLVARAAVAPDDLLDAAIRAAEAWAWTNALVTRFDDQARRSVAAGLPDGPLRGVPFALKDLWAQMTGVVTTNGSRLFTGAPATVDSEIVRRFRRSGLVTFAKTNTPELGLSPTTEPALFGPTHNPWRRGVSAGGSSGGAAAAVAAGIVPMAHATDGGGSIRIPAACCGLFGLKPTRGRVPFGPERGEGWGGMSAQGVVSRSVRDSAVALAAISGSMPGDPYAAPGDPAGYPDDAAGAPGRLRVGVCTTAPEPLDVDARCVDAVRATALRCADLGHHVTEVSWPFDPQVLATARQRIIGPHVAQAVDARAAQLGRPLADDDLEPFTAAVAQAGRQGTATGYVAGIQAMHQVGRAMGELFERIDVLLTPTLAHPPFPIAGPPGDLPGMPLEQVRLLTTFPSVANVSGQPAMSVPLDHYPDGLPLGSHFTGRFGDEATLFRLAAQLERAHPWFDRVPPLP